jgi:hypothetical protein
MKRKMYLSHAFGQLLIGSLAMFGCHANGEVLAFSNKASFLASTGATSATGPLPNIGLISGGAGAAQWVGNVKFSIAAPSTELYIGAGTAPACSGGVIHCDWTLRLPDADIAISGTENLNAQLAAPIFAVGFDFVKPMSDPAYAAPGPSTFTVTLKLSGTVVDEFTFYTPSTNYPADTADFVGLWSSAPFDRVEIRERTGGINDEYFGQFYTGILPFRCCGCSK